MHAKDAAGASDTSELLQLAETAGGLLTSTLEDGTDCGETGGIAWSQVSTDAGSSNSTTLEPESATNEPDGTGAAPSEQRYEPLDVVGSGVFGTVFLGRDRDTNEQVAVKQIGFDDDSNDGVPAHVIREVSLLRDFVHPNIVQLKDLQVTGQGFQLIFEYVPDDLHQILKGFRREGAKMPMSDVLGYTQDLLSGVHACHCRLIIHRDLKPQNVLVHPVHGLKICDFGLSRIFSPSSKAYTPEVVTLWYRGPELLLGQPTYSSEVDIWSAGCILAEMATGDPTFPGDSEIGTIFKIMQLLGSPTEATWPGFEQATPLWKASFPRWPPTGLASLYERRPELGSAGMDLLRGMLAMNPASRLTSRRAKARALGLAAQHGAA